MNGHRFSASVLLFRHLGHTTVCNINYPTQDYNAKLSDFGLAKDGPVGDKSHVSTRIMGTYGYAAPEYIMTGTPEFILFLNVDSIIKVQPLICIMCQSAGARLWILFLGLH